MKKGDRITCPSCGLLMGRVSQEVDGDGPTMNHFRHDERFRDAMKKFSVGQNFFNLWLDCKCGSTAFDFPNIHTDRGWVSYRDSD